MNKSTIRTLVMPALILLTAVSSFGLGQSLVSLVGISQKTYAEVIVNESGELVGATITSPPGSRGEVAAWVTNQGMKLLEHPLDPARVYAYLYEADIATGDAELTFSGIPVYIATDTEQLLFACAFFAGSLAPDYLCTMDGGAFQVSATLGGCPAMDFSCDPYSLIMVSGQDSQFIAAWLDGSASPLQLMQSVQPAGN